MASRFRTVAGLCVADEQPRAGCSGRLEFALPGGLRGGHAAGLQGGRAAGLRGGYSAEARTSAPGGLEKRLRIVRIQGANCRDLPLRQHAGRPGWLQPYTVSDLHLRCMYDPAVMARTAVLNARDTRIGAVYLCAAIPLRKRLDFANAHV